MHEGVDLLAPAGAVVRAPESGRVVAVLTDLTRACGYGVVLRGESGLRWTLCHFESAPTVARGDDVSEGDVVGHVGETGDATGPHLHLQASRDGRPVDVTRLLADALASERVVPVASTERGGRRGRTSPASGAVVVALLVLLALSSARR